MSNVKRITEGVREMLAILEAGDATEDERTGAAMTIVEAVAPDIMDLCYGPLRVDQRTAVEWMAELLEAALPDNMGGWPDLFWPGDGWEQWEVDANQALQRYRELMTPGGRDDQRPKGPVPPLGSRHEATSRHDRETHWLRKNNRSDLHPAVPAQDYEAHMTLYGAAGVRRCADVDRTPNAHLAEHHADDGESITEEWLRSVGFERDSFGRYELHPFGFLGPSLAWVDPAVNTYWCGEVVYEGRRWPNPLNTRGAVRLICRALGLDLKEND